MYLKVETVKARGSRNSSVARTCWLAKAQRPWNPRGRSQACSRWSTTPLTVGRLF